jgi:hypothetical protein
MKRTARTRYRYHVSGAFGFPVDMLRYDAAHPETESDSIVIGNSIRHETEGRVTVSLVGLRPPTEGRWNSFTWRLEPGVVQFDVPA